jgi:hypothetical protein
MTAREIVKTAFGLLRTCYAFPDLAERVAAAIQARLAAGEYDGMDEAALADLLTSRLFTWRLTSRDGSMSAVVPTAGLVF